MGKLTAEQRVREYNRGQKAAREARSRSWSEPWAYPFESDQHYEERREAFNEGYGIIDATPSQPSSRVAKTRQQRFAVLYASGAPGEIRTHDLCLRRTVHHLTKPRLLRSFGPI